MCFRHGVLETIYNISNVKEQQWPWWRTICSFVFIHAPSPAKWPRWLWGRRCSSTAAAIWAHNFPCMSKVVCIFIIFWWVLRGQGKCTFPFGVYLNLLSLLQISCVLYQCGYNLVHLLYGLGPSSQITVFLTVNKIFGEAESLVGSLLGANI